MSEWYPDSATIIEDRINMAIDSLGDSQSIN